MMVVEIKEKVRNNRQRNFLFFVSAHYGYDDEQKTDKKA